MKKIVIVCLFLTGLVAMLSAQSELQPIAEVKLTKREPITLGQVKFRVAALERDGRVRLTPSDRKKILEQMIQERLVAQAAEKESIRVLDSEVNEFFNNMISQMTGRPMTEAEFAKIVKEREGISLDDFMKKENGMTVREFKEFLKAQLVGQRYVMTKKQNEIQSIKGATDAEIRKYYDLNKLSFTRPDGMLLFLVMAPKTGKAKINELHTQLKASTKNMADIKQKAQNGSAGYQAGEIFVGKTPDTAMRMGIPEIELEKIFNMKKNEVSDVNEMQDNFQFFVVLDKFSAKILELSDLVEPSSTNTLYEYIKNMLFMGAQQKAMQEATISVVNELYKSENYRITKDDETLMKLLAW